MMLFRRADGRCVLHTGDFRFTPDMLSGPELRTAQIDTVHLDATYGHPRYSFPPQQATVDLIARLAVERLAADAASGTESTLVGSHAPWANVLSSTNGSGPSSRSWNCQTYRRTCSRPTQARRPCTSPAGTF